MGMGAGKRVGGEVGEGERIENWWGKEEGKRLGRKG